MIDLLREERDRRRDALTAAEIALSEAEKEEETLETVSEVGPPAGAIAMGAQTVKSEFNALLRYGGRKQRDIDPAVREVLSHVKLSNEGIALRERARPKIIAPLIIKLPYYFLCFLLDSLFIADPISRFWFLETVARMPYFTYITMLHTYETLGWWRKRPEIKRVHFAEELNEYHHLLIMESLGGDEKFLVQCNLF